MERFFNSSIFRMAVYANTVSFVIGLPAVIIMILAQFGVDGKLFKPFLNYAYSSIILPSMWSWMFVPLILLLNLPLKYLERNDRFIHRFSLKKINLFQNFYSIYFLFLFIIVIVGAILANGFKDMRLPLNIK